MQIKSTPISGLFEITPKQFSDQRGWFLELFKQINLSEISPNTNYVQDNLSFSKKGVLRGLHLQLDPFQQGKIVTVIQGKVLDVIVDLRKSSTTFGKVYTCVLNSEEHKLLVIPEGFAHGFSALEDSYFFYKCSSIYSPNHETGIRWNDPKLNIDWKLTNPILSEKDEHLPTLDELLIKSVISPE